MRQAKHFEQTVEERVMEEVGLKVKNIRYYKSQAMGTFRVAAFRLFLWSLMVMIR